MYILALMGHDKKGKSPTLRQLIQMIADDPHGSFICNSDKKRAEGVQKDVSLPLLYHHRLLAVTTAGDAPSGLRPFFEQYGDFAEIVVCATHEEGTATYRYIESFRQKGHDVEFFLKTVVDDADRQTWTNQQDAQALKNKIDAWIKKEDTK